MSKKVRFLVLAVSGLIVGTGASLVIAPGPAAARYCSQQGCYEQAPGPTCDFSGEQTNCTSYIGCEEDECGVI